MCEQAISVLCDLRVDYKCRTEQLYFYSMNSSIQWLLYSVHGFIRSLPILTYIIAT